ncbi:hypothetical protein N7448_007324 [Penicillium atrosanguineum]|uniref:Uncharacterized protein n=1 Tax=Penicillium atrosanguineum TaxID=1132637 RepID=A0A9W9QE08_9EURO|nr:uncharacterized protein N7443_001646 [Penicillium atrosanguineum]KAJ5126545.1 hypothetical protein N7448_007324 [Penicillium atrosanguineum]KAJ5146748.1 hypothetical protein N7526_000100 [Penicillium atrosanguineum]KAJ5314762.1 hypothetical protein N7443_001646 [Penicillium atrosanguineum]KAJ5331934.1 hypothetical protein N7476_001717 [Penicillium atrosanguineum]
MSSGSSTAESSDMQESAFLKRSRAIHLGRLSLSFLILTGAIATIACEAVPFRHYTSTAKWASAGLALWPLNFDLRPTIAAMSCGCVIAVLNLIYVVIALLPSPHSRIRVLNTCASTSAIAGFITALIGLLFIIYLPSSAYPSGFTENETLYSWTCKWKNTSSTTTPLHFSRDCHNTRAGFALLCFLLGLEIVMGVGAALGSYFQRDVSRRREQEFQLEKLEIATKQVYQN